MLVASISAPLTACCTAAQSPLAQASAIANVSAANSVLGQYAVG